MDFKGKVVLISGATGGMGEEIVKQLSTEGCKLALFARRENKLKEITEKVSSEKTQCIYKKCDVTKNSDVKDAVDFTIKEYGKIDIAILTSGVLVPIPIESFNSKVIIESMEINFFGYVYFIDYLLQLMKKQKSGTIAATSTLPDKRGVPGWGSYGASKAAISWLMESLRAEGKQKYNINFITIKPGSVVTPMIEGFHRKGAITSEKAATRIINGIKKERRVIQFPFYQVFPIRFGDLFPPIVYDGQDVEMLKGDGFPTVEEK